MWSFTFTSPTCLVMYLGIGTAYLSLNLKSKNKLDKHFVFAFMISRCNTYIRPTFRVLIPLRELTTCTHYLQVHY